MLIRKGSRPGRLLNRPQWTTRPKKSALQGRGTVRSTVVGASAAADILQVR